MNRDNPGRRLPTSRAPAAAARLLGVDAARGIALLGMIAVHALYTVAKDGGPTWVYTIAGGRSAALFAVLAGVGIAFVTGRRQVRPGPQGRGAVAMLVTRALAIGALGLLLGYTDASIAAVILPYYAVLFLLAVPLVFLPSRVLVGTGVAVALVAPVISHVIRPLLPSPLGINPSFGYLVQDPLGLLVELSVTGYYPALPWMTYLCAGLLLGRMRLSSAQVATKMLAGGAVLAAGAAGLSWVLLNPLGGLARIADTLPPDSRSATEQVTLIPAGTTPTSSWWWLATDAPHASTPLDLLHTTGTSVAVLGAMLALNHLSQPLARHIVAATQRPLAIAGAMPLTLYTASIVFMNSSLDQFGAVAGFVVQLVAALLIALLWRITVGSGPLESGLAWLSHRARYAAAGQRLRPQGARNRSHPPDAA